MKRQIHILATVGLAVLWLPDTVLPQEVRLRPVDSLYTDAAAVGFKSPESVAHDGASLLVIADTGNRRLVVFDESEDTLIPTGEIRLSQIPYPLAVEISPRGEILVLDGRFLRIARLTPEGEFKGYVADPLAAGRSDMLVKNFTIDREGNVYVLDSSGGRILVLDDSGARIREITFPEEVEFLSDLTVNRAGVVFAVDSVGRRVFSAKTDDAILRALTEPMREDMTFPTDIAAGPDGNLFIVDRHGGGIVVIGQNGDFRGRQSAMGWTEGFLRYPAGIDIEGQRLFVADRGNNRVQIFTILR